MEKHGMGGLEFISSAKQSEWTWPAVVNFFFGGAGAGFYLLGFILMDVRGGESAMTHPVLFGPLAAMLIGLGFLFLAVEAGRPFRFRYLLCHLQRAWISRETLAFLSFVAAVVLDYLFPRLGFKSWAALSALVFMTSQGFIVYFSRAIPAWNVSVMPFFFVSSGLTSGAGVLLLLAALRVFALGNALVLLSLLCVVLNLIVWLFYKRWSKAIALPLASKALRRPVVLFFTILLGSLLPLLLLSLLQIRTYSGVGESLTLILFAVSGLAMLIGVAAQKSAILLSAGYTRKIVLEP